MRRKWTAHHKCPCFCGQPSCSSLAVCGGYRFDLLERSMPRHQASVARRSRPDRASGLRKPNLRKARTSNSHMLRKDADNTARRDPVMIEIVRCDALDRVAQKQKLRLAFDG